MALAHGNLTPTGKKIRAECLRKVEGEGHEQDEDAVSEEGLLKDEVDELFECEDHPIITTRINNSNVL